MPTRVDTRPSLYSGGLERGGDATRRRGKREGANLREGATKSRLHGLKILLFLLLFSSFAQPPFFSPDLGKSVRVDPISHASLSFPTLFSLVSNFITYLNLLNVPGTLEINEFDA